jgi:hypothetical protein
MLYQPELTAHRNNLRKPKNYRLLRSLEGQTVPDIVPISGKMLEPSLSNIQEAGDVHGFASTAPFQKIPDVRSGDGS